MGAQTELNAEIKRPITWVRRKIVAKNDLDKLGELIDLSKVDMEKESRFEISNCDCQGVCKSACIHSCRGGCVGGCGQNCKGGPTLQWGNR